MVRPAVAGDIPDRCQLVIGTYGYKVAKGEKISLKAQLARFREPMFGITNDEFLNARDFDYFSFIHIDDWTKGGGQIAVDVHDNVSKARYYDSTSIDQRERSRLKLVKDITKAQSLTNATALPMKPAGGPLMYVGDLSAVKYHVDWSGAPTSAATSSAGNVIALEEDGPYMYGAVAGVGINRWTLGSASAGTLWNSTVTNYTRLLWANRIIYAINPSTLYAFNSAGTQQSYSPIFTPPTGWTLVDLCAKRGGAVDSPIIVMGNRDQRTFMWYWDGTTIRDYISMPLGFVGQRIKQYLGVLYIYGYRLSQSGAALPCAYYVAQDRLGFLGYFGIEQANGEPTAAGTTLNANYAIDVSDNSVWFAVQTGSNRDVWRYDVVNGGLSRWHRLAANAGTIGDLAIYRGGPWLTTLTEGIFSTASTYAATGTLDMSDLHLGKPWAPVLWTAIEVTHSKLLTGESITLSGSIDQGVSYTAYTSATVGKTRTTFVISTASGGSTSNPYLRPRLVLGSPGATSPQVYSVALKGALVDPTGVLMTVVVDCPQFSMDRQGRQDWQGANGSERLRNIIDLYEAQAVTSLMYMAPNTVRDRLVKTVDVKIVDYELVMPDDIGVDTEDPGVWVYGAVKVTMRQVT